MPPTYKATLSQYALSPSLPIWGDLEGCSLKTMMFEKYPSISPYTYCANNPVMFVDPDGRDKVPWFDRKKDENLYQGALNTWDDGAIHIFVHGNPMGISKQGKENPTDFINSPERFNYFLSQVSSKWVNRQNEDNLVVVLHACNTSQFAKQLSKHFKDVKFIAPNERLYASKNGEIGTYKAKYVDSEGNYNKQKKDGTYDKSRSDIPGSWKVYLNGIEIESYKGNWKPKENPTLLDRLIYQE